MQFIEEKELPEFSIEVECERCKSKLLLNIEDISINVSKDYSYAEHINDYSYMYNYYYICPKCNKINIVYDIPEYAQEEICMNKRIYGIERFIGIIISILLGLLLIVLIF